MAQNAATGNGQLPLKNVVLCSTSLPQDARTLLADLAVQMGAVHKLDLTIDVTHLLVGDINTAKYRYVAKERPDVHVLRPDWIEAVRAMWMEGSDVDMTVLEKEYRHPTLAGLKICMTGFTDNQERTSIAKTVQEHGAQYHGDLTKQITHLVVAKPEGAKYDAAKAWGVATVSTKWLEDSEKRGMALDATLYDPTLPLEQQGLGAFREEARPRQSLGKRARESEAQSAMGESGPRKLRRSASSRLTNHSQGLWQDIAVEDSMLHPAEPDQWSTRDTEPQHKAEPEKIDDTINADQQATSEATMQSEGLFSGWHVCILGFERTRAKRLADFLQPHGATVVKDVNSLGNTADDPFFKSRCVLVPHARPDVEPQLDSMPAGTVIATEWWVERCIHKKVVIDPDVVLLCQPLWDIEIPELSKMTISTTGFVGIEFRQTGEAIKLTGATYQEQISPSLSIIVNGASTLRKEKAFYAAKHHIPVVSPDWLWASLRAKHKAPIEKYRLELPAMDPAELGGRSSSTTPAPSELSKPEPTARTDSPVPARFSNTKKRHATPALQLQATKPVLRAAPKPSGPFIHEDDDDDDPLAVVNDEPLKSQSLSPKRPQPLQNISPNASPRKPGPELLPDQKVFDKPSNLHEAPASPPTSLPDTSAAPPEAAPPQPQHRSQSELTANLQSIMDQRRASSRTLSSSSQIQNPAQRNKTRRLGRAASGTSLNARSFSNDSYQQSESVESADEPAVATSRLVPEPPSTQLGYETPEAEAARLQMGKRLGTVFSDEAGGTRLASLGTVKDSGTPATGSRGRGRQRKVN